MKTRALTFKELNSILDLLKYGFHYKEDQKVRTFRAKKKIYYLLLFQVNTGLRVGDILQLRRKDILNSRINITEQKTHKKRSFTIPDTLYNYIKSYADKNGITPDSNLIKISDRQIQRHLKATSDFLSLDGIGTHSFRKFAASNIYDLTGHDIVATQEFLQHSSTAVTMRYMRRGSDNLEQAINQNINII